MARDRTPPIERVAAVTERLAVLLAAGVSPSAAWAYLAEGSASGRRRRQAPALGDSVLTEAAAAASDGSDVAEAIAAAADGAGRSRTRRPGNPIQQSPETDAWLTVAAAWSVAMDTGAPLAGCLRDLSRSQRALGQAQRDVEAALAGPRSTSRLVMILPAVGLLFGLMLGFDTIGTLLGTIPGLVCLGAAALLMLSGVALVCCDGSPRDAALECPRSGDRPHGDRDVVRGIRRPRDFFCRCGARCLPTGGLVCRSHGDRCCARTLPGRWRARC